MSSRKQQVTRAIAESVELSQGGKPRDADPPPKARGQCNAGLYASWGASDLHLFFRFRSSVLGLKAQTIEPQAETLGKRPTPFWNESDALATRNPRRNDREARLAEMLRKARAKAEVAHAKLEKLTLEQPPDDAKVDAAVAARDRALVAVLACELAMDVEPDEPGGPDAMPTGGRQVHVSSPDRRITDASIDAVTNLRRIRAGLGAVPHLQLDLSYIFDPPRVHEKLEGVFQELVWAVLHDAPLREAYEAEMASSRRRIPLDTWIVQRLDQEESKRSFKMDGWRDLIIDGAVARAEEKALELIHAYEEQTTPPVEVREERERVERDSAERLRTRAKRKSKRIAADTFLMKVDE